ncbi:MAG: glycosyltransferase family 2 protein [Silvibacterium sp.]|nr:glycosyltransferase family 2 protein [Silvibacterium sp.]
MSSPELVSVVIPTINRPSLLRKAVLSVLRQTWFPLEIIVVIDGEDRASEECLASIHDQRLRVLPLAINMGGSEARNIGVRAAKGAWVAFLDDDDEWLPEKIALQMQAARTHPQNFPVISCRLIVRTPESELIRPVRALDSRLPVSEQLFCRRTVEDGPFTLQTSTLLMRRETMLAIPFRAGLQRHQDWDWVLRAARDPRVGFHQLSEPLTIFRANDSRPSVGRVLDWQFSLRWAQEMRRYFTPRAYSFFIATECLPRAVKVKAGPAVYLRLVGEFFAAGSPTLPSLAWMAAFLCIPQRWRNNAKKFFQVLRSARQSINHPNPAHTVRSDAPMLRTNQFETH